MDLNRAEFERVWRGAYAKEALPEIVKVEVERFQSLDGFNFGTGIAASFDAHSGQRIGSVAVSSNQAGESVIQIEEEADTSLGLVLETHYFWTLGKDRLVGIGPFVAIKSSDSDLIDEAGLGVMIGLRRSRGDTNSFNIGVGVMVDPNARVLADGFTVNTPVPAGLTAVPTKGETRFSVGVIFSYTF